MIGSNTATKILARSLQKSRKASTSSEFRHQQIEKRLWSIYGQYLSVVKTRINHPWVYTTNFWWFGGWFIVDLPCLTHVIPHFSPVQSIQVPSEVGIVGYSTWTAFGPGLGRTSLTTMDQVFFCGLQMGKAKNAHPKSVWSSRSFMCMYIYIYLHK